MPSEAAKAYGTLWRMYGASGLALDARWLLRESLTKEERRDGIAWSLAKYGPIGPDPYFMLSGDDRYEAGRTELEVLPED